MGRESRTTVNWAVPAASVAFAVNAAVIAILYVLFGRVLGPLVDVARGLRELERRQYDVRLPRPQPYELAAITDRFNALAQDLESTARLRADGVVIDGDTLHGDGSSARVRRTSSRPGCAECARAGEASADVLAVVVPDAGRLQSEQTYPVFAP